jgi:hypothetical protein
MTEWRSDMENAPRDGTLILLWYPEKRMLPARPNLGRWMRGGWNGGSGPQAPTHWMPLPPPPEGEEA